MNTNIICCTWSEHKHTWNDCCYTWSHKHNWKGTCYTWTTHQQRCVKHLQNVITQLMPFVLYINHNSANDKKHPSNHGTCIVPVSVTCTCDYMIMW